MYRELIPESSTSWYLDDSHVCVSVSVCTSVRSRVLNQDWHPHRHKLRKHHTGFAHTRTMHLRHTRSWHFCAFRQNGSRVRIWPALILVYLNVISFTSKCIKKTHCRLDHNSNGWRNSGDSLSIGISLHLAARRSGMSPTSAVLFATFVVALSASRHWFSCSVQHQCTSWAFLRSVNAQQWSVTTFSCREVLLNRFSPCPLVHCLAWRYHTLLTIPQRVSCGLCWLLVLLCPYHTVSLAILAFLSSASSSVCFVRDILSSLGTFLCVARTTRSTAP